MLAKLGEDVVQVGALADREAAARALKLLPADSRMLDGQSDSRDVLGDSRRSAILTGAVGGIATTASSLPYPSVMANQFSMG